MGYLFNINTKEIVFKWKEFASVKQLKDTIIVTEYQQLPVGENYSLVYLPFLETKIFDKNGSIEKRHKYLIDKHKYSEKEIKKALKQYRGVSKRRDKIIHHGEWQYTYYRLFWCYVSGSKKALEYLINVKEGRYWYDSDYEEYEFLVTTCIRIKENR